MKMPITPSISIGASALVSYAAAIVGAHSSLFLLGFFYVVPLYL